MTFSNLALTAETADSARMNEEMVDTMKAAGTIHSSEVEQAFRRVPRHPFLPGMNWGRVYEDEAIPTHFAEGTEKAISSSSQPTVMADDAGTASGVARDARAGDRAGTGYNAALMASLAGGGENVWAVDVG